MREDQHNVFNVDLEPLLKVLLAKVYLTAQIQLERIVKNVKMDSNWTMANAKIHQLIVYKVIKVEHARNAKMDISYLDINA